MWLQAPLLTGDVLDLTLLVRVTTLGSNSSNQVGLVVDERSAEIISSILGGVQSVGLEREREGIRRCCLKA